MKITSVLATLLLVSACATQASAHMRTHKISHHAHFGSYSLYRGSPVARSRFYNSYASGPNDVGGGSAGGEMWNGRSASEFGGGAP
jgi:hypothetical protein